MSAEQIQSLLNQSDDYFLKRELKLALKTAQQALKVSDEITFASGKIRSNLILGKIYTVSGRFSAESDHFPKALQFIEQADHFNKLEHHNGQSIEIYLAYGDVFQNKLDFPKALEYYNKALDYARKEKHQSCIIKSLCSLSYHYVLEKALDDAFAFILEARSLIDENTPASIKTDVYNQLCQVYIKRQEYTRVPDYAAEALSISREIGAVEKEIKALNNIAVFYGTQASYKTAMEYFLDALEKSKVINYRHNTAQSLINIATIYASLYNHREAANRYLTVLKDYDDVIDDYTSVIVRNNLGNIYFHSDDPENALKRFEEAHALSVKINYKEMAALSLAQIGRAYIALDDFEKAIKNIEQAQELIQGLGDFNKKQINLINLGSVSFHRKEYEKAIELINQGIDTAKRMGDNENEMLSYQILSKIYQEQKDYKKALEYQLTYSKAQEGYDQEKRNRQVMDMEIQFAIRDKQKEIEQLTKENEYQALLLEQSDQIANQNVQLLQVNDELRQFAYVASHDLKEPLRMIGSYTQLIQRKYKDQIDEDAEQFFGFINEGVIRMNNLLDALLKYATIGKSEMEMQLVDLNQVLEICQINLQVAIEETSTTIRVEGDLPQLTSVQSLLIQLFQNLISNAIKFRKPETLPVVIIASKEEEDYFSISVSDNGIGINPEFQERIFVIFQRLHSRAQYEGTGIGLSICQKIIQQLGGTITVKSQVGAGATFTFTLPK